jgi:hypothetical protein
MKFIYFILLLPLFSCSSHEIVSDNEIVEGGDNIYVESPPYQIKVILELDTNNSTYFLKYYDSDDKNADTLYFETLKLPVSHEKGLFYIWIQDIDKGSIGPFTNLLDTGIVFIEPVKNDSIYEFRRH